MRSEDKSLILQPFPFDWFHVNNVDSPIITVGTVRKLNKELMEKLRNRDKKIRFTYSDTF